jgi:hypothetical protein
VDEFDDVVVCDVDVGNGRADDRIRLSVICCATIRLLHLEISHFYYKKKEIKD